MDEKIKNLYGKDTKEAYAELLELEELSESTDALYPYVEEFIDMIKNEKYIIRVRGFRLLCRQAKWDAENKLDRAADDFLRILDDEKPTAIRQALEYLGFAVPHKKALHEKIRRKALSIDCSKLKDSMRPLIEKDIEKLLSIIPAAE